MPGPQLIRECLFGLQLIRSCSTYLWERFLSAIGRRHVRVEDFPYTEAFWTSLIGKPNSIQTRRLAETRSEPRYGNLDLRSFYFISFLKLSNKLNFFNRDFQCPSSSIISLLANILLFLFPKTSEFTTHFNIILKPSSKVAKYFGVYHLLSIISSK